MDPAEDPEELELLLQEVRRIQVQSHRLVSSVMSGGYHSVFRGSGIEFQEVREYEPGDDPRSVDWNVTARFGRPFVKKFVDERELTVLFVLDLSASMGGGWGVFSARQVAARFVACLALSAVQNDDKVGLVAFGGGVEHYVPAKKGLGHALRVLRDVLVVRGRGGGDGEVGRVPPMDAALAFVRRVVRRRAIVFVVSDLLGPPPGLPWVLCRRMHDVTAVRLLLPERVVAGVGMVRVVDPESGVVRVVDFGDAGVRGAYQAQVEAARVRTGDVLARAKIDVLEIEVPTREGVDVVAQPILDFFAMRSKRGAKR